MKSIEGKARVQEPRGAEEHVTPQPVQQEEIPRGVTPTRSGALLSYAQPGAVKGPAVPIRVQR
jgi:hypothetical protein